MKFLSSIYSKGIHVRPASCGCPTKTFITNAEPRPSSPQNLETCTSPTAKPCFHDSLSRQRARRRCLAPPLHPPSLHPRPRRRRPPPRLLLRSFPSRSRPSLSACSAKPPSPPPFSPRLPTLPPRRQRKRLQRQTRSSTREVDCTAVSGPSSKATRTRAPERSAGLKNEPLRWDSEGDWSYNGKVTDF